MRKRLRKRIDQLRRRRRHEKKTIRRHTRSLHWVRAQLARATRQLRALSGGRKQTIREALRHVGFHERGSSNCGVPFNREFGFGCVPWCGTFVGHCLQAGGVWNVTSRVASVALVEDDARASRNGFKRWKSRVSGKPGDAVVLFGRGVHVGLVVRRVKGGYMTCEGNTSGSSGGSQSNGGMVAYKFRAFSAVHGIAEPRYR